MDPELKIHLNLLGPSVNLMTITLKHACEQNGSVSVLYFIYILLVL